MSREVQNRVVRERHARAEKFDSMSERQRDYAIRLSVREFLKPVKDRLSPTEILNRAETVDYNPHKAKFGRVAPTGEFE